MSLNKFNFKSLIIFASLILLVRVNVYSTVYTTVQSGNWNNNNTWSPSKPNMTYGFNDTVYVQHDVTLNSNLNVFGYFVVNNNVTLSKINKSITIYENSVFINNGTVEVKNLTLNWGTNTLINNGSIVLHGSFVNREGEFTNNSTMTVASNFNNSWDATTVNDGSIEVAGNFINSYSFSGIGYLYVDGNFTNDWSSSFSTSGELDIQGNFTNRGDAQLNNGVSIAGNFTNDWSSTISMTDTVLVSGNISNRGPLSNSGYFSGNSFTNEGAFTSTGTTKLFGNVVNKSSIINSGSFDVSGDFLNKWSSTSVTNSGDFVVGGDLTNKGVVNNNGLMYVVDNLNNTYQINNDGNLFVDNSVTGTGDVDGSGVLCNSDGQTDPTGGAKANNVTCTVCNGTVNTLPVELVAFEVEFVENTQVDINWATATEENNDYFEVLHSTNGTDFETIARVKGAGNSNNMLYYQATDFNAVEGINYYQLKQVDYDGKTTFSDIKTVRINSDNDISLYPNPANLGQEIKVEFSEVLNYNAEIYDITGRLVMSFNGNDNHIQISTANLTKGNYILRIVEGEQVGVKRFIVK